MEAYNVEEEKNIAKVQQEKLSPEKTIENPIKEVLLGLIKVNEMHPLQKTGKTQLGDLFKAILSLDIKAGEKMINEFYTSIGNSTLIAINKAPLIEKLEDINIVVPKKGEAKPINNLDQIKEIDDIIAANKENNQLALESLRLEKQKNKQLRARLARCESKFKAQPKNFASIESKIKQTIKNVSFEKIEGLFKEKNDKIVELNEKISKIQKNLKKKKENVLNKNLIETQVQEFHQKIFNFNKSIQDIIISSNERLSNIISLCKTTKFKSGKDKEAILLCTIEELESKNEIKKNEIHKLKFDLEKFALRFEKVEKEKNEFSEINETNKKDIEIITEEIRRLTQEKIKQNEKLQILITENQELKKANQNTPEADNIIEELAKENLIKDEEINKLINEVKILKNNLNSKTQENKDLLTEIETSKEGITHLIKNLNIPQCPTKRLDKLIENLYQEIPKLRSPQAQTVEPTNTNVEENNQIIEKLACTNIEQEETIKMLISQQEINKNALQDKVKELEELYNEMENCKKLLIESIFSLHSQLPKSKKLFSFCEAIQKEIEKLVAGQANPTTQSVIIPNK